MSGQPNFIQSASDSQVLKANNDSQWALFRDKAAATLGKYFAMNKDGVKEPLGGGGVNIESGSFSRLATDGNGVQNIITTKKAKIIFFIAIDTTNNPGENYSSSGKDNIINSSSLTGSPGNSFGDLDNSINIGNVHLGNPGYSAKVTAINNDSYDVTWVVYGGGLNTTVQWHAITE